jgi:NAD(P)-dependent dehydrogenase (short-subunit alcohol dehydrogenase family)
MNAPQDYYKGKVAVVTGAASGIGLALVEAMLSHGADKVVLADVNDDDLKRETARLEAQYPGKTLGVRCDVAKEGDVQAMIAQAAAFGGRIDLLFNNAGAGFAGKFEDQANADWEKAFAINFYGPLYAIRAVLPIMRGQGGGHIVNTISGLAFVPMPYRAMYGATKAALNGLTLALRYEFWDDNIRVTSATPGAVATAIFKDRALPVNVQTPKEAAGAILEGVADNRRIVLGDQQDVVSAKHCFDPDNAAWFDEHLHDVAQKRRSGETAF